MRLSWGIITLPHYLLIKYCRDQSIKIFLCNGFLKFILVTIHFYVFTSLHVNNLCNELSRYKLFAKSNQFLTPYQQTTKR